MIFLMIFSVVSVINFNPANRNDLTYGEYEFELESRPGGGSVIVTELNGQQVEFQNLPLQVAYLDVDPLAISLLRNGQQVVLVTDPSYNENDAGFIDYARLQLGLALLKTANAMSREDDRFEQPVLNCTHASPQMPVVMFNITNTTSSVTTDNSCIFINARDQDLMRLKDRIIFEYYGIIENGEVVLS